jgi:DNA polymerase III subunit delta
VRVLHAEQLRSHLAGSLRRAYLVAGDEPLLVQEAVDQLRTAVRARGVSERLVFDVMSGFDWSAWRLQVRSLGLFATERLIELRLTATKLTVEGATAVTEFLDDPGADTLLIQSPEWNKTAENLAWVKSIERDGVVVPVRALRPDELPRWLAQRAQTLGVTLTADATAELVARVEGNLLAAHQELSKLALLAPGKSIDAPLLVELVADYARYNVFSVFDAVLAGSAARVRRVLAGLRAEGSHPAEIFGYLVNQVTALALAESLRAQGVSLQSHWQSARVFGPRQAQFERALGRGWSRRMVEAQRIDLVCKGRAAGDPWVEIERWLFRSTMPAPRGTRFAA